MDCFDIFGLFYFLDDLIVVNKMKIIEALKVGIRAGSN